MALVSEFDRQGNWLFRWRSYLPFALLVPLLAAFRTFDDPNHDPNLQQWWTIVCIGVSLAGLALRAIAVGSAAPNTSGRNTHGQVADAVNTTGIYSVVRHPLYLGNYLMWLGITMYCHNGWLVAVFTLMFFLYYERIMMAEENYLSGKFGAAFTEWAARTPAFIQRWSQWQPQHS